MDAFLNELLLPLLKGAVLACALWLLVWSMRRQVMPAMRRAWCWACLRLHGLWKWLMRLWRGEVPIQMRGLLLVMGLCTAAGAGVMWRMGNRFEIVRQTSGLVMRLDRWTGRTWLMDPAWKRWYEVKE